MQKVESRLTIIFTAFLFSSFVYMIVGFALSKSGWKALISDTGLYQILFGLFLVLSISLLVLILKLKNRPKPDSEKSLISKYILLFALAEVPSILGLVLFLLTGKFLFLLALCFFSIVAFFLIKPQDVTG
jgi:peptidoglycan/LPS O-acetylase OafA/YrhL